MNINYKPSYFNNFEKIAVRGQKNFKKLATNISIGEITLNANNNNIKNLLFKMASKRCRTL